MTHSVAVAPALDVMAVLLATCHTPTPAHPVRAPQSVSWDRAVALVNANLFEEAFQTHTLSVQLVLKDGSTVRTSEPEIDEIMRVIDGCGVKLRARPGARRLLARYGKMAGLRCGDAL